VATSLTVDGWTVIAAGVKPGDTVVTDGQLRLAPGAKVSIKTPQSADSSTNTPSASERK